MPRKLACHTGSGFGRCFPTIWSAFCALGFSVLGIPVCLTAVLNPAGWFRRGWPDPFLLCFPISACAGLSVLGILFASSAVLILSRVDLVATDDLLAVLTFR